MHAPVPVWGLVDDRAGHMGQVLGVIGKLGLPYLLKRLEYNWKIRLPSALIGASLTALAQERRSAITPPWPKLVVASGRRTLPVARYIKKHSPSTVVVYLMWPGTTKGLDLIAVPKHDRHHSGAQVMTTIAPLHAVTPETLAAAREAWLPQFRHLPRPWIAMSLGGTTKHGRFKPGDWRALVTAARSLAPTGTLMMTTSRRTPPDALEMIGPLLAGGSHLLHRWDSDKDNPYLGLLACADAVITTGDSLSMCAEACVSGKPVYIFAPPHAVSKKHQRLHQSLYERELARPFRDQMRLDWQPSSHLDDAGQVADAIRARFPNVSQG
jgi:uncharacterized protein